RDRIDAAGNGLDANTGRRLLLARPLLIERRPADAIREALHDERTILDGGKNEGGDFGVISEQIAFGQLAVGPENFRRGRRADLFAAGQIDDAVTTSVLEGSQLRDHSGGGRIQFAAAPATGPARSWS